MLKHCLHIVFHAPKAKRLGGMDSEYSPVVLGFSMGAPCILTPQSLSKLHSFQGSFRLQITLRTFLKKSTKKRNGRFLS